MDTHDAVVQIRERVSQIEQKVQTIDDRAMRIESILATIENKINEIHSDQIVFDQDAMIRHDELRELLAQLITQQTAEKQRRVSRKITLSEGTH
jgi:hypothetical protein